MLHGPRPRTWQRTAARREAQMLAGSRPDDASAYLRVAEPVRAALAAGRPVVALESTVIAHGLPRPANVEVAGAMEDAIAAEGAVPATIAVLDGQIVVGLSTAEIQRLATEEQVWKASRRDLAPALARRATAATTVAGTLACAALAGIRVFATGRIGGRDPRRATLPGHSGGPSPLG